MSVPLKRVAEHIGSLQLQLLEAEVEVESLHSALEAKEDELRASQADAVRRVDESGSPGDLSG